MLLFHSLLWLSVVFASFFKLPQSKCFCMILFSHPMVCISIHLNFFNCVISSIDLQYLCICKPFLSLALPVLLLLIFIFIPVPFLSLYSSIHSSPLIPILYSVCHISSCCLTCPFIFFFFPCRYFHYSILFEALGSALYAAAYSVIYLFYSLILHLPRRCLFFISVSTF